MPLVDMRDMLHHAYRNGYAVGAFNAVGLEFIEAIVAAAERTRSPVILSVVESHIECDGFAPRTEARAAGGPACDLELLLAATEAAARRASVPTAIHLDRGQSYESAVRAINLGCNGVMVDASQESFPTNVAQTRRVVEMAHACGVPVEGELGRAAGLEGEDGEKRRGSSAYTAVEEAKAYVARTGADFLAVSIGTAQGRLRGRPKLDFERLKRIHEAVDVPLVIHGGTGLSDEQYRRLINHGVAKINCSTLLAAALCANGKTNGAADAGLSQGGRAAIAAEVERVSRLFGAAGRAAEVLAQCRPWRNVEHVILYNVEGAEDAEVEAMMARGRDVLARIPGVKRVVTGWAVTERPKFRFCWIIEFVHAKVIASYRDNPEHVAFANELFRPMAGDRISIDFLETARLAHADRLGLPGARTMQRGVS